MPSGPPCCGLGTPRRGWPARSTGTGGGWPIRRVAAGVPGAGRRRGPPDRRPPLHGRLPAPRRRCPGSAPPAAGVPTMTEQYVLRVNGTDGEVRDAWVGESLLYVLRERLGLPGAKGACEQGECGSCSVLLDGVLVCSCLVLAASAIGREITTVEGLAERPSDSGLTDVQQAFVDEGGVQCGFCTPGPDRRRPRPVGPCAGPDRARGARSPVRQPLPLHGLRADPCRGAGHGGGPPGRSASVLIVHEEMVVSSTVAVASHDRGGRVVGRA